jgi:hypothetical protein
LYGTEDVTRLHSVEWWNQQVYFDNQWYSCHYLNLINLFLSLSYLVMLIKTIISYNKVTV